MTCWWGEGGVPALMKPSLHQSEMTPRTMSQSTQPPVTGPVGAGVRAVVLVYLRP